MVRKTESVCIIKYMKNKNKNKTTGVIKANKDLEIKIMAEVKKEDPKNAEEIIKANTADKRVTTRPVNN